MARKSIRMCVDRVIPFRLKPIAARLAVDENLDNGPAPVRRRPGVSANVVKIALETGKRWKPGRTLDIRFLDGSATQRKKVQAHAERWMEYANVRLAFGNKRTADLRISFVADDGSWSGVGTDCLVREYFPLAEPTMNFGWLRDDTEDAEYRRVVLHEFGHALAAIHEHQNPRGGIRWNLEAVYAYFGGPPNNWSREETDYNVVNKYAADQLNASGFDPRSIMLYAFPPELVQGGKGTQENDDLSRKDKLWMRRWYPR